MKRITFTALCFITLFSLISPEMPAAQKIYYDYQDAGGDWENKEIGHRIALMADGPGQTGFIDASIPKRGYYQIYTSILHTWDHSWPRIEFTVIQHGRTRFEGYLTREPGELSHQKKGRWLFRSFSRGKLLLLDRGTARIEFKLTAPKGKRKNAETAIEKEIYLGSFVVVPGNESTGFMNIVEAERAEGGWDIIEYKQEERCGVLESIEGKQARLQITLPESGHYRLMALLRNTRATELTVSVNPENGGDRVVSTLLNSDSLWKVQHFTTGFFTAGTHTITLEGAGDSTLLIDSFFMVPFYEEPEKFSLSCSTVYFSHNPGAADLAEALQQIADAGFRAVDLVAYDDTFGITETTPGNEIKETKKLLQQLKLQVSSIHFGVIPLRSDEEAIAKIKWALKLAQTFEARTIVAPPSLDINGKSFLPRTEGLQTLTQIINEIKPLLDEKDISLGLENHSGNQWLLQSSDDCLAARHLLSRNVYLIPDEDHFSLAGEDPVSAFRLLTPYSPFLHFKTSNPQKMQALKEVLKTEHWQGHLSIEVEETGQTLDEWFTIYNRNLTL